MLSDVRVPESNDSLVQRAIAGEYLSISDMAFNGYLGGDIHDNVYFWEREKLFTQSLDMDDYTVGLFM